MESFFSGFGVSIIKKQEFAEAIRSLDGFPDELHVVGNRDAVFSSLVAVVGTRNPTPYGLRAANYFCRELAARGVGIVSGLAIGIDASAHRACVREGALTVAVLAHGLDQIYPVENRALALSILESQGALVSEYEPGTPPLRHHFPQRNRIISGLGTASLIIEAGAKSGSLITARCALDQGRDVFVVPGPFDGPSFRGSHSLLREGAKLVDSIDEVLIDLNPLSLTPLRPSTDWEQEPYWAQVFERVSGKATLLELVELSGLSASAVVDAMDAGQARGRVTGLGLQTWVWLGEAPRHLH